MERIYLDHAATTPVDPEVAAVMMHYMLAGYGNPSSIHGFGREARAAVEEAREKVAKLIGADTKEITFTSGGTESDNLAIRGVALASRERGNHIITSKVEHHAVLHTCQSLEKEGYEVTYIPVDSYGMVDPDDVRRAIKPSTILITIMLANNEVGTIQPIQEIGTLAKQQGVYLHTDAVQAVGNIPVDVDDLNVDLLSCSGHKIYGPKGVGALYIRHGTKIRPITHGGRHERGLRPGTENVPGIVGFGKAAELALLHGEARSRHVKRLRDRFVHGLMDKIDDIRLNGHPERRLPNNANVSIRFVEGESMLLNLDLAGVSASSGSACTSGSLEPSHVLMAMRVPHEEAHGSLRFTFGKGNTEQDVEYVLDILPSIVSKLRAMSPLYSGRKGG